MSILTQAIRASLNADTNKIHDHGQWWRSDTLLLDAQHVASMLRRLGLGESDRVLLALPNSYAFAAVYTASLLCGTVVVPVNPNTPSPELSKAMRRYQAKAAFLSKSMESVWKSVLSRHGLSRLTVDLDFPADRLGGLQVWTAGIDFLADRPGGLQTGTAGSDAPGEDGTAAWSDPDDDTPAVLMYTSGTTGEPKGVLLQHRHLWAAANNVIYSHELTERDVAYCVLPLFHINAQVIVLLSSLVSGSRLVMTERFRASTFWQTIEDHGVTWVSAVPAILTILSKTEDAPLPSRSLRFVRSASAPLPTAVLRQFETRFHVPVIESYGMTEAAGQICINPLPPGLRKPGSAGLPCRVNLRVVDDHRNPLPAWQTGEIEICGDNVIESYLLASPQGADQIPHAGPVRAEVEVCARATATATSCDGLPWLPTGDIGYLDDDGYLFITGRAKEVINRAGEKFSPREVEEVLYEHPSVAKAAVAGIPDVTYGEQVVAWVIPAPGTTHTRDELTSELLERCHNSLAKYKWPQTVYLVESLPVGPTGKVKKHLLQKGTVSVATATLPDPGAADPLRSGRAAAGDL